ncbi:transporter major facilitator family [Entamoeba histolytica]|uniref:Transporter, major facilitator family n=5 Tax=Entamoeba histolytica TaxID=5759 RepID=C4M0A6_ENTH1|nr:transporter, major facilitator family [Entamoeba histolytica HM-1:IMSS]EAL47457.1 transporter, major facilitator family [Entamoeba histolytica HM-1:IMSS]EMD47001.1 transporter major facilitator family protein, putative [Entamoeba histolytica KU27]ENY60457.1 transporter, major facilitator family protein, putative [Entamoeba histolytica HM-1:IMSS-A]GAT94583.1 transporter major facilitator family [Entamoeba histolytica]|eukprot:XP_652845.1 transporter, major facilitator family [Entamoeba histolytica HM-1:IMSS]
MNKIIELISSLFWNFPRACLAGFMFNFASYFYWLVVPLKCVDMGGSTLDLSLLQTTAFVIYSIISPICGKLGDKFNPYILIRIAMCFFVVAVAIILIWPNTFFVLYISVAIWPFCTAFFWPVTTGTVGFEAPLGCENRNTSLYQVSWSIGKALGFLFGGMLKGALGTNALYICIGIVAINMLLYPFTHPKRIREKIKQMKKEKTKPKEVSDITVEFTVHQQGSHEVNIPVEMVNSTPSELQDTKSSSEIQIHEETNNINDIKVKWNVNDYKNKTYIYLGYVMQLGVYGTSAILSNSYVTLAKDKDITIPFGQNTVEMYIGIIFFCYFIAQTLVMAIMSFSTFWIYMRSLLLLFQFFYLMFLITLGLSAQPYVNWFLAFLGGLAGGFAYQTSTYYSMRASESSKSMFMGISECVGGLGNALLPLISGLLCTYMNNNYIQIYIAIIVMVLCLIIEEIVYYIGYAINKRRQAKRVDPTKDYHQEDNKKNTGCSMEITPN